ncbi:MAG: DNA-directed RNA polymerase subunit omega [Candidatus Hatepunaea meridiana]|nr:DNA-directed RNA polymerase subunit omega [Candidatus Hatepunaea meridiana]
MIEEIQKQEQEQTDTESGEVNESISDVKGRIPGDILLTDGLDIDESSEEDTELKEKTDFGSGLPWLINDFNGITKSVYEAAMVAASRAHQIGRQQKQEIDIWFRSHEPVDGQGEEEEYEPGTDHFKHRKPTVKALDELTNKKLVFRYPDEEVK